MQEKRDLSSKVNKKVESETIVKNGINKSEHGADIKIFRMKKISLVIVSVFFMQMSWAQTEVNINSSTAISVPEENARVILTPFLCDFKMLTEEAVYDTLDTQVSVRSIANNAKMWIDNYETMLKSQMMHKYGADAILSPTREAKTSSKGTLIIIVRGYPVKYVNFRVAKKEDEWIWNTSIKGASSTTTRTGTVLGQ